MPAAYPTRGPSNPVSVTMPPCPVETRMDLPRFSGEALAHLAAIFSN
jgi:hypothetical protein